MANKISFKWLTPEFVNGMIQESQNHSSRVAYIASKTLCWKHYNATSQWLSPDGEFAIVDSSLEDSPHPIAFENRIKKTVDDQTSVLLMNRPIVHHQPFSEKPQDADLADHMDLMLSGLWEADGANVGNVMYTLLQEANICGLSVGKVVWDPYNRYKGKEGEISVFKVVPNDLFLDPYATNDHRGLDCRYKIHRLWMTPEYIISKYGSDGEIALGLRSKVGRKTEGHKYGGWAIYAGMTTQELHSGVPSGEEKEGGTVDPRIAVYEVWLKPTQNFDPEKLAGEKYEGVDLSYGVVVTMINNYIVRVIPNPYAEYKTIAELDPQTGMSVSKRKLLGSLLDPFVFIYHQTTSDHEGRNLIYMAHGMVEQMIPVQTGYNSIMTNIAINARSVANPATAVMEDALVNKDPNDITGQPSEIHVISSRYSMGGPATAIQTLQAGQMPSYVQSLALDYRNSIQELGGIHPEMTGQAPQGTSHLPGVALAGLQSAAFTPLRTPIEQLDLCIYDLACRCDGLMQQKYKVGRHVPVSNQGQLRYLQWQMAYSSTQFIRRVVSGSTTPIADIDRINTQTQVLGLVTQALASQTPQVMKATAIMLINLKNPYLYDHIQLLETEIAKMEAQQQGLEQLGMSQISGQLQGQEQPQGGGIEEFAQMLGISPDDMMNSVDTEEQGQEQYA